VLHVLLHEELITDLQIIKMLKSIIYTLPIVVIF